MKYEPRDMIRGSVAIAPLARLLSAARRCAL